MELPQPTRNPFAVEQIVGHEPHVAEPAHTPVVLATEWSEPGSLAIDTVQGEAEPEPSLAPESQHTYAAAIEDYYRTHRGTIIGMLRNRLGASQEDAEDAVQEAITQIIARQDGLGVPLLPGYFFRASINQCLTLYNKRKNEVLGGDDSLSKTPDLFSNYGMYELHDAIKNALGRMPSAEAGILRRFARGDTWDEIKEDLPYSHGVTRKHANNMRKILGRQAMREGWR